MSTVIKVENLSKKYTLRHQQIEQYTALRDVITNGVKNISKKLLSPFTSYASPVTETQEDFWALKDVSFEVKQGDRVGIIGRNGAGKSTLLKVLSRITEPTQGRISIKGRVASLLEVGTGFHPELTGRENIFLNGAILGMSRADIKLKFDEIVAFAEVEKFLDTPVKRYSSGMYVRLAFAVAAHLEPEILIVDEVLAVGDAQFQKKCLGKMEEVGKDGRTVLFVSHNMGAIRSICTKGILLSNGIVKNIGDVSEVVEEYLAHITKKICIEQNWGVDKAPGDPALKLIHVSVNQGRSNSGSLIDSKDTNISIELLATKDISMAAISCGIENEKGEAVLHTQSNLFANSISIKTGANYLVFTLPPLLLRPGKYLVSIGATIPHIHSYFREKDVVSFTIETGNVEINRYPESAWRGVLNPQIGKWSQPITSPSFDYLTYK
jgi:lipopolysaccharide transport system ATP-binding protein